MEHIKVGDVVRVAKEDILDRFLSSHKCKWQLGEEFKIKEISISFGDIFLHDGNGNNLNSKRAEIVKFAETK